MDRKPTVFKYLSQIFMIFGIMSLLLDIFTLLFGEKAFGFSTMFSLGKEGVSVSTSLQYLLASAVTVTVRYFFMTDIIIKKMPVIIRMVLMFLSVIAAMSAMIAGFGWFPVNSASSWAMFGISFAICCTAGTVISWLNEKLENKRLDDALKKAKEKL